MPKLTIVIPNYNGGENLKRAIESCRTIQIPENDYEILIVDNKSTDNSIEIATEMKVKFTNIRIVQNEKNLGRIKNWNIGIEKAGGRYLIFLFSNDLINEKNNIHELLQNLDSDQTISISMSSLLKKERDKRYIKKAYFDRIVKCPSKKFALNCLNRGLLPFGPIQSIIYRLDDIMSNKNKFLEEFPLTQMKSFLLRKHANVKTLCLTPILK